MPAYLNVPRASLTMMLAGWRARECAYARASFLSFLFLGLGGSTVLSTSPRCVR